MEMKDLELIKVWKERSAYEPGPTLTEEKMIDVEKALGFQLPDVYKQLMKLQNGGEIALPLYPDDDLPFVIQYLQELELEKGVGLSPVFIQALNLPENLVLITGDMYNWLALDYRLASQEEPSVVFLFEGDDGTWKEIHLADTFTQLIHDILDEIKKL